MINMWREMKTEIRELLWALPAEIIKIENSQMLLICIRIVPLNNTVKYSKIEYIRVQHM